MVIIAASLSFLLFIQRIWPIEQRRLHNDLIGWHITVLGTTYAVIIGFMLYAVWTNFELASSNTESEADCLVNVARFAQGLPDQDAERMQKLALQYATQMLNDEWPAMSRVELSHSSERTVAELWSEANRAGAVTPSQQVSRDHVLTELSTMTQHRRLRRLQCYADLPGILWMVLDAGAFVTLLSACMFGSADFKLHVVQVTTLSLLVSLVLVAIADINSPFQGSVHVGATSFERAREVLTQPGRLGRG